MLFICYNLSLPILKYGFIVMCKLLDHTIGKNLVMMMLFLIALTKALSNIMCRHSSA